MQKHQLPPDFSSPKVTIVAVSQITKQTLSAREAPRRAQNTVAKPTCFRSPSLFHGYDSSVRVLPADVDTGIVFRRTDLTNASEIPATCDYVVKEPRRTVLESGEARVETVDHIMAALAGMQVDNCVVEINAPEVPAYDGSCRAFCDGIVDAGLTSQGADVPLVTIDGIHTIQSGDRRQSLVLKPYVHSTAAITYHFDYGVRQVIPPQQFSAEITPEEFYDQISAARTFVLETEIAALRKMGYGLHLTAKDILVFGKDGPIDNTLRWADECVRHKILDCVGDLALSGCVFHGHLAATRTGHHLNHEMAKVLTMIRKGVPNTVLQAS